MTSLIPAAQRTEVFYPSSDGEPLAETSIHIDAIINAVVALRHYLAGQQAIVLTNQFLYYAEGFPKLRVAPDVMVIFNVPPGPRDNYKTWEEKQSPAVIFEITSAGTREQDEAFKKNLYEQLEIQEYWQFDPKGEWIAEQLRGYRLQGETYVPIADSHSQPLQLRLAVDGPLIAFYRANGEKLLAPNELIEALRQETLARQSAELELEQERLRAEQERQRAEQEHQRAEQERLRAEQERQRAEQEQQRAEQAAAETERLREQLRLLGIEPEI